jgi:hypothetical protein
LRDPVLDGSGSLKLSPPLLSPVPGENSFCSTAVISNATAVIAITGKSKQAAENQRGICHHSQYNSGRKKFAPITGDNRGETATAFERESPVFVGEKHIAALHQQYTC